ncbi:MAG: PH domain-containing protein [Candidatus Magasanikbacteria bacterium]
MSLDSVVKIKSYEKIIYTLRRHGITFFPYLMIFIIILLIPIVVYWLFSTAFVNTMQNPVTFPLIILFASAYYLSTFLFFYSFFVEFYLDAWIITNDRLVDIRQISLFARTVAEVDLYQIQDVSSEVHGFFPTIFNYGDVYLQTAGPIPKFIIHNVHRPDKIREVIIELSSEDKKFHSGK